MNIMRGKKKLIGISLGLIGTGILITGIGFGIQGAGLNRNTENRPHRWYQTIRINDGAWSYGLDFTNDIHLFQIEN